MEGGCWGDTSVQEEIPAGADSLGAHHAQDPLQRHVRDHLCFFRRVGNNRPEHRQAEFDIPWDSTGLWALPLHPWDAEGDPQVAVEGRATEEGRTQQDACTASKGHRRVERHWRFHLQRQWGGSDCHLLTHKLTNQLWRSFQIGLPETDTSLRPFQVTQSHMEHDKHLVHDSRADGRVTRHNRWEFEPFQHH